MRRHSPEVDGLRALAVLGVIAFHFFPEYFPGGFLGVDAFFVISGFVVTRSCLELTSSPFVDFLFQFWVRRFWRIFPSLVSVVVVGLLLIVLVDPDPQGSLHTAFFGLIGLANVQQFAGRNDYFAEQSGLNGFTHLWSLGVEEQFYLVFPLLIFLAGKTSRTSRVFLFLAPTLASMGAFHYLNVTGHTSAAFFLFPFRLWQIAIGVLVAVLIGQTSSLNSRVAACAKLAGILVLTTQFLLDGSTSHFSSLVATMVMAVVIATTQFHQLKHLRIVSVSAAIGRRSYSLYLVHWVVLVLFRLTVGLRGVLLPASLALTIVLSEANFQFIENRFRDERWNARGFKILLFGAASILALLFSITISNNNLLFSGHRHDNHALLPRMECISETSRRWLVGDSHANGYSNILSQAFNTDCLQVRDETTGNFFLFELAGTELRTIAFLDEQPFLDAMSRGKPKELWIVNYLQGFFQDQQSAYSSADWKIGSYVGPDGTQLQDFMQAFDFRLEQYRKVLVKAEEVGTEVFIELPPPDFDWVGQGGLEWRDENQMCSSSWFTFGRQSRFSEICDLYRSPATVARSTVETRRKHIVDGLTRLADEFASLHLIDPLGALCLSNICSTHLDGVRVFEDDDHYSVKGEDLIADRLMTLIK